MPASSLTLSSAGHRCPQPKLTASAVFGDQKPDLSLVSPAKVNMFLRIIKRREDGFHELASLFQTVSLFDQLDFWSQPADAACSMEVDGRSVNAELIPTDETNLVRSAHAGVCLSRSKCAHTQAARVPQVMRALALFTERTGAARGVHCRLLKKIPAQVVPATRLVAGCGLFVGVCGWLCVAGCLQLAVHAALCVAVAWHFVRWTVAPAV